MALPLTNHLWISSLRRSPSPSPSPERRRRSDGAGGAGHSPNRARRRSAGSRGAETSASPPGVSAWEAEADSPEGIVAAQRLATEQHARLVESPLAGVLASHEREVLLRKITQALTVAEIDFLLANQDKVHTAWLAQFR